MKRTMGRVVMVWLLGGSAMACLPTSQGELGNGGFTYVCSDTGIDLACDDSFFDTSLVPDAIAVGAKFRLQYSGDKPDSEGGGTLAVSMVSTSPKLLHDSSLDFSFASPATVAVLARSANGDVADFIHLRGVALHHLAIADDLGDPMTSVTLHDFEQISLVATPEDEDANLLAGRLTYQWSSSDEEVVSLDPGFDDNTVTLAAGKPGTAIVSLVVGDQHTEIPVTVEETP